MHHHHRCSTPTAAVSIGLGVAVALGLAACGSSPSEPSEPSVEPESRIRSHPLPTISDIDFEALGGTRIAFERTFLNEGEPPGIYVVNGGDGEVSGHLGGTSLSGPVVSSDGAHVAFTTLTPYDRNRTTQTLWDVYVTRLDGTDVRQVSAFPGNEGDPSWTPGGTLLFTVRDQVQTTHIYEQSPVTGPADRRVVRSLRPSDPQQWTLVDGPPVASPDGTVAFAGFGSDAGIYLLSPEGEVTHAYEPEPDHRAMAPAWSPDGSRLAFLEAAAGRAHVRILTLSEGTSESIGSVPTSTGNGGVSGSPLWSACWSRDGSRVVFTSPWAAYHAHVYVAVVDGSQDPVAVTSATDVVDRSVSCLG